MPAGRPTKYNATIQKAADDYVNGGFESSGDVVPSLAGLACELDVTRNTLKNWGDQHGQFLTTLERCAQKQERIALNGGLRNEFNSAITKLLLANHGYSDKLQQDVTSSDGSMTPAPGIDASKLSNAALKELINARSAEADQ